MKLYLASGNAHKVSEFNALAASSALPITVLSAREAGGMPPVVEDGETFPENAAKKARALHAALGGSAWVMADDSGLCVDHLRGGPGVHSAYYAGPAGDSAANLAKLVAVMRGVPAADRRAAFACVLVLMSPRGEGWTFEGRCPGRLLDEPRGGAGFGYDPLFVPEGSTATFAEMPEDLKNRISHRGRAWEAFAAWLRNRS